jgi:predicted Zn-dependent protease
MNGQTAHKAVLIVFFLFLTGCAAIVPAPQKHPPAATPETTIEKKDFPEAKPRPREVASLHLTEQGQMLLERGKADDAISVLERAVSIHAANGKNYYFLAEAWLKKGNLKQAKEWNRLAEMYLAGDREWSQRVYDQRTRLNARAR